MAGPGTSATWRIEKLTGRHRRLLAVALDALRRRLIAARRPQGLSDAEVERAFLAWSDASGRGRPLALVWLDSPAQAVGIEWLRGPFLDFSRTEREAAGPPRLPRVVVDRLWLRYLARTGGAPTAGVPVVGPLAGHGGETCPGRSV
jgi:hypothetical protein